MLRRPIAILLYALRILLSAGVPVFLVAAAVRVHYLNPTTIALALVMVVFATALASGWLEALIAAVSAGLTLDYFVYPPRGLGIRSVDEIVAFVVFLITAIATGQLSARAQRDKEDAIRRQEELEKLNRISDAISGCESAESPARQIADKLVEILDVGSVEIYDRFTGEIWRSGARASFIAEDRMRDVAEGKTAGSLDARTAIRPMRGGISLAGSIAMERGGASAALLDAIADKAGTALARAHAARKATELEIERRSQDFKSAALDALARESRNALNSIKIAVTYLLSQCRGAVGEDREMLTMIEQTAGHLSHCIEKALRMSHAAAGQFACDKNAHDLKGIILTALENLRPLLRDRRIQIDTADGLPAVACDREMIQKVVELLVENAVRYSPARSPVGISSGYVAGRMVVTVSDAGPGIEEDERALIFEKNYRGRRDRLRNSGGGPGLASARLLIESHGGEIWVTNAPEGGALFHFSLPAGEVCEEAEGSFSWR